MFEQFRQPVNYNLKNPNPVNDMVLTQVHLDFMMRGHKVTREELIKCGRKVAEIVPDYNRNMPVTLIEFKVKVFLLDKGYIQFVDDSLEVFKNRNLKGYEFNKDNWVWKRKMEDKFS